MKKDFVQGMIGIFPYKYDVFGVFGFVSVKDSDAAKYQPVSMASMCKAETAGIHNSRKFTTTAEIKYNMRTCCVIKEKLIIERLNRV